MVRFPAEVMKAILTFNDHSRQRNAARRILKCWRSREYRQLGWSKRYSLYLHRHYYVHERLGLSQWREPVKNRPFSPSACGAGPSNGNNYASPYTAASKRIREEYLHLWFYNRSKRVKLS